MGKSKLMDDNETKRLAGELSSHIIPFKDLHGFGCGWGYAIYRGDLLIGVVHDAHPCDKIVWTVYAQSEVRSCGYPGMTHLMPVNLLQDTVALILACMELFRSKRETYIIYQGDDGEWQVLPDPGKLGNNTKQRSKLMDILIEGETGEMYAVDGPYTKEVVATIAHGLSALPALPRDHPTRKALEIGRKVLEAMHGDELDPDGIIELASQDEGKTWFVRVPVRDSRPFIGLGWLASLPDPTFIRCNTGLDADHAVVTEHGIHRLGIGRFLSWKDVAWQKLPWVQNASPKTCPKWEPEE